MQPTSFLTALPRAISSQSRELTDSAKVRLCIPLNPFLFLNDFPTHTKFTRLASNLVFSLHKEGMLFLQILNFLLTIMPLSPKSFLRLLCPSPALGKPPNLTSHRRSPVQHTALETNRGNPKFHQYSLLRQQHHAGSFN